MDLALLEDFEGDGEEREERQRGVDRAPPRAQRSRDHPIKSTRRAM